jgi:hypothetical protein
MHPFRASDFEPRYLRGFWPRGRQLCLFGGVNLAILAQFGRFGTHGRHFEPFWAVSWNLGPEQPILGHILPFRRWRHSSDGDLLYSGRLLTAASLRSLSGFKAQCGLYFYAVASGIRHAPVYRRRLPHRFRAVQQGTAPRSMLCP